MDVTNFPFDVQTCTVTFGPWQHGANEIMLNGTGNVYISPLIVARFDKAIYQFRIDDMDNIFPWSTY